MLVYFTSPGMAQSDNHAEIGFHLDYSTQKLIGGGIEVGGTFEKHYIGVNSLVFPSRGRSVCTTFINLKYGYSVNNFTPFIIGGYYTSGGESVRFKEGLNGYEYGGGLSYQFTDSPIKLTAQISNIKTDFSFSLVREF